MKLTLDHTQRLNLHALLGARRADVGPIARSGQSRTAPPAVPHFTGAPPWNTSDAPSSN
jgi:hypothetical protein